MSTAFPETSAAWQMLKRNFRAYFCEVLVGWAMRVAPQGYVPSYVEACLDAYHRRGPFTEPPEACRHGVQKHMICPSCALREYQER